MTKTSNGVWRTYNGKPIFIQHVEPKVRRFDGDGTWRVVNGKPVFIEKGKHVGLALVEAKQAEAVKAAPAAEAQPTTIINIQGQVLGNKEFVAQLISSLAQYSNSSPTADVERAEVKTFSQPQKVLKKTVSDNDVRNLAASDGLKGVTVDVRAVEAETRQVITFKADAASMLQSVQARIELARKLVECLGS